MFFFMIPFGEPENLGTWNFHFWQSFISIPDEGFSKMKVFQRNLPNAPIILYGAVVSCLFRYFHAQNVVPINPHYLGKNPSQAIGTIR